MQSRHVVRLVLGGTAVAALCAAGSASAQIDQTAAPQRTTSTLPLPADDGSGDIIVTAQKRTERLQDVPLSIQAFTQRDIEQQGIQRIDDYASRSAGVRLSRDSTQATISIRGIASSTNAETTSATAGIYIDDYPIYDTWFRFSSPDLRVFDVQRIEVLRGPQGTLYGATSLSGSIRILTNKPDLTAIAAGFEGTASGTDGGDGSYAANAMVNVPLIDDRLGVRAVAYVRGDGGYVDVPGRADNVDDRRTYGGRFYLSFQANETLNLLASVNHQHDAQDDQSATFYYPPAGRTIEQWNSTLPTRTRSDLVFASLVADQELGGGHLTLTGTYGENHSRNQFDVTNYTTLLGLTTPTLQFQPSDSDTKILEARYTSGASGRFRYVAGAYYNSRYRSFQQIAEQDALAPYLGTGNLYTVFADNRATEIAAFGEGTLTIARRLEATAGLRVFRNTYHFNGDVTGLFNSFATPLTPSLTDVGNNQSDYTPRVSLLYRFSPQVNVYATASKGYRFGLTNYNSGANGGTPLTYKSDTLWNYEAGVRTTLFGGRGTFNASAYYIDWSDIQLSFRNANGQAYVTNAGDARSYGVESEFRFRPVSGLEINGAASLGRAELTKDNPGILRRAASIRGPAIYGVMSGDALPGSQAFSGSGGVQYTAAHLGAGDAYVRVDDVYVGPAYTDFIKAGSLRIGDYNLVNLRLGYRLEQVELTVFAENVFNSRGVVNAVANADLLGADAAYRVRPRTVGATLRARY